MIKHSAFHAGLSVFDTQRLATHWAGYTSPLRYGGSVKHEYFAVRNGVGIFDTSPLYKTRVSGPDAAALLSGVLVRDAAALRAGRGHYTAWCTDGGLLMGDGVLFRETEESYLLTSVAPVFGWLARHRGSRTSAFELHDLSDQIAALAIQGPRSSAVLREWLGDLRPFALTQANVAGATVAISRTGYTGDLGYELWVQAEDAADVLEAVLAAGEPHGLRAYGEQAMDLLRIEAGLPLAGVEFHDAALAATHHDQVSLDEAGLGWLVPTVDRPFKGARAIAAERAEHTSRWRTVGIMVDAHDWDHLHREEGEFPPKSELRVDGESLVVHPDTRRPCGYVTSLVYSPWLQRHIGIARVEAALDTTTVWLETPLHHRTRTVTATLVQLPHLNLPRRTA